MDRAIEEVIERAMDLEPIDRLLVAERLLLSVEEAPGHRQKWEKEVERRYNEYRHGRLPIHTAEEVNERINRVLKS